MLFLGVALVAGLAPLWRGSGEAAPLSAAFPGWPTAFEGRALKPQSLSQREERFARGFPGRIARFDDGRREVIVRFVTAATRRLHPASDCFRGIGHTVTPLPGRLTADGQHMSCFRAVHGSEALRVCEVIRDDSGASWPDVSAWYWSALLGHSKAPWWSFVVAERE